MLAAGAIPRGYGFDLVSFPNYLFEALGWIIVAALSGSWAGACPARDSPDLCGCRRRSRRESEVLP
jgi:hypothetical protein